jgi:hypothetical protein
MTIDRLGSLYISPLPPSDSVSVQLSDFAERMAGIVCDIFPLAARKPEIRRYQENGQDLVELHWPGSIEQEVLLKIIIGGATTEPPIPDNRVQIYVNSVQNAELLVRALLDEIPGSSAPPLVK